MNINNKVTMRHMRQLIVFTIVLLIALWNYTIVLEMFGFVGNIIFPFLVGGAIAFVLNVPMNFMEKKLFKNKAALKNKKLQRVARPLSLTLAIVFVLSIVSLVMFVVVPQLGQTFVSLGRNISRFIPRAMAWLEVQFNDNKEILALIGEMDMNWDKMIDGMIDFFKNGVGNVFDSTISVATSIVGSVTTAFIAFVFACYILLQKEKLSVQIKKILFAYLPENKVIPVLQICTLTYKTFSNFLTGQCLEALVLGTMFFVVMSIIRLPYALLVGVLIAFTALIPIFGAFIGCAVGAFLILMVDPVKAIVFVVLFLVLQQIEGNLIYPKVVGSSVGLPSIWVLAAVSIGGSLMGVVGMLVFIPLVSVLYTILRGDVYRRLEKKGIVL